MSSGNGQKTIYARFYNAPGLSSPVVSSTIMLAASGSAAFQSGVIQGLISSKGAAITGAITSITKRLVFGMTSSDVKSLQEILAQDKSIYPEGIISGYFGKLTQKAVERFQEKYGIANPGIIGYGEVGPHTRAKLNELLAGESASSQTSEATSTQTQSSTSATVQTQTSPAANAQLIQRLETQIQGLQQQLVVLLSEMVQSLQSQKK